MKFIFIKKKWFILPITLLVMVVIGNWYYLNPGNVQPASVGKSTSNLDIHMATVEFKSKTADGKEIEVYRFDPGTIFVPQGKDVTLRIYGVNGSEHPFFIEGTNIKGVVKKGEETVIPLHFKEKGIYKLICTTHIHAAPMNAYIVVD